MYNYKMGSLVVALVLGVGFLACASPSTHKNEDVVQVEVINLFTIAIIPFTDSYDGSIVGINPQDVSSISVETAYNLPTYVQIEATAIYMSNGRRFSVLESYDEVVDLLTTPW